MEHQNSDDQGNHSSATPQVSLGAMLREARERLNFSVADVAVQIKFSPRQIEALEADDFKNLPETAFLRGFVRSYAKILNLDAQPLLAALPKEDVATAELVPPSVDVPYPVDNASQIQTLILLGAALLLAVVAVGFSVWHYTIPPKQSTSAKFETPVPLTAEKQAMPTPPVQEQSTPVPSNHSKTKRESSSTSEQISMQPEKSQRERIKAITSTTQPSATAAKSSVRAAKTKAVAAAAKSSVLAAKTKAAAAAAQSSVRATKTKAVAVAAKSSVLAAKTKTQSESTDSGNMNEMEAPNTKLRLVFDEESWAEITDKDGNLISSQINPRGSELNVKGRLPLSLVIGHGATTHLFKDGKPVDLTPYINSSSEVARVTLK